LVTTCGGWLQVLPEALFSPRKEKGGLRMKRNQILIVGVALVGLVLLPLAAILYVVLHWKGASALVWPPLDWGSLDLSKLLTSIGLDLPDLHLDTLVDQVANSSERANDTGHRGSITGGTGAGAAGSGAGRPPDRLGQETDGYIERLKEHLSETWQEIKDALSMKPLPPEPQGSKK
jgi:hypothetical protein